MTAKKVFTSTAGLRGVSAGRTAICSCGVEGMGLNYRGYDILELAARSTFEEVAWLLLRGALPTSAELDGYRKRLAGLRELPPALKDVLERAPASAHPMDV
ncbi:MAG: citrate/2-methylcitrate synthase, partial [Thermomonas haemolytica]